MKNKYWSDSSKPFLIAEIGGNHEGDLNRALNMIHLASEMEPMLLNSNPILEIH